MNFRFISSWDDGKRLDLRLAKLLKKYNIPAIFYIPTCCELTDDEIMSLYKMGFEIGGHTFSHPQDLKLLNHIELECEIESNKKFLEDILKTKITKFCYPRGRYDDNVIEAVIKAGYKEARTTKVLCNKEPDNRFKTSTTIHIYQRSEYKEIDWLKLAKDLFIKTKKENGVYHLWGHSHEIDRDNNWEKLEELLKFIRENI